ncbi:FAD-binding domain-containing protein, partial [Pisolithus croceorrhizus]
INARTPHDVQAAVTFFLRYDRDLVVKNTGWIILAGHLAGRGIFVVWAHKMNFYTSRMTPIFTLLGEPISEAHQGKSSYSSYIGFGNYGVMVGAACSGGSVGAGGGWLEGGGCTFAPTYGFRVDSAVQVTVITSTGERLTINKYLYPDLFWALRGGGSTYGITTPITYRTYQQVPVVLYFMQAIVTNMTELIGE